jgi:uncharacterized protein (TIGR03067 family)
MKAAFVWSLTTVLLVGGPAWSKGKAKTDSSKIVGTWMIVAGENEGKKEPAARLKGTKVTITKDTIVVTDSKDQKTYVAKYTLDTGKKPWQIKMTASTGPDKGKTAYGIMERNGDTLKLCYALPGAKAPKKFATKKGGRDLLFVMKRAKGK